MFISLVSSPTCGTTKRSSDQQIGRKVSKRVCNLNRNISIIWVNSHINKTYSIYTLVSIFSTSLIISALVIIPFIKKFSNLLCFSASST